MNPRSQGEGKQTGMLDFLSCFPTLISSCFLTCAKVSESCSIVSDSLRPHGLYSPWNSLGQYTGVGSHSLFPGDLPNPGVKPRSPALQEDSLPAEPPGKSKNTGVGSLSLLQWIFQTQESNWGRSKLVLYQLS